MKKSVVVLVDTDETIIAPLEIKFLEGMSEYIELQVITDTDYFGYYFSHPQDADILIISEELYSPELQKQNFRNVFVLTESKNENLSERGVTYIFKYTSIREIYNRIIAEGDLKKRDKTKTTQVVMVCSASGGVGKTTLAMGISQYLSQHYQRVLYVNAERVNTFHFYLNDKTSLPSSLYPEITDNKNDAYKLVKNAVRNEGFDYMPPFTKSLSAIGLGFSVYRRVIAGARMSAEYDVIVVDTDNIVDMEKAELAALADKVILMLINTESSIFAMNILTENMDCSDKEKYYFVCNACSDDLSEESYGKLAGKAGFPISERIAYIEKLETMDLQEIAEHEEIQKVAALIL